MRALRSILFLLLSFCLGGCLEVGFLSFEEANPSGEPNGQSSQLAALIRIQGPQTLTAGDCVPMEVQSFNLNGKLTSVQSALSVQLEVLSQGQTSVDSFYSDKKCLESLVVANRVTVPLGSGKSRQVFYFRYTKSGVHKIRPTVLGFRAGDFLFVMQPSVFSNFLIQGPPFITAGTCTRYSVTRVDRFENPIAGFESLNVDRRSGEGALYPAVDSNCVGLGFSRLGLVINAQESSADFYFKNAKAETSDLAALGGSTFVIRTTSERPTTIFLNGPPDIARGVCSAFEMSLRDSQALNLASREVVQNVVLSGAQFYGDSACQIPFSGNRTSLAAGEATRTVFLKHDTITDSLSVSFQDPDRVLASGPPLDLAVVRSGGLDPSFGQSGTARLLGLSGNALVTTAKRQGSFLLLAGYVQEGENADWFVARLSASGSLDKNFGNQGIVRVDMGSQWDRAYALQVDTRNRIVLAGVTRVGTRERMAAARLTSGGALDRNFSGDGKVVLNAFNGDVETRALGIRPTGGFVMAGTVRGSDGVANMAVVAVSDSGALEVQRSIDFNGSRSGKANDDLAYGLYVESQNSYYVAGAMKRDRYFDMAWVRVNGAFNVVARGTVDFGKQHHDVARAVTLHQGRVLLVGSTRRHTRNAFAMARFFTSGALDNGFRGGKIVTEFGKESQAVAHALEVDSVGRILVAGFSQRKAFKNGFALVRYKSDGGLDPHFGSEGKLVHHLGNENDEARAVLINSAGRICLAGTTQTATLLGKPAMSCFE